MEQKKILWVVLSISLFVVLIFGVAIYLYAPFRNQSTMNSAEIANLDNLESTNIKVDPVKWTRNPESIPELEKENDSPVNIKNNITIVNGEVEAEATENENTEDEQSVSVNGLVENEKDEKKTTELPESLAKQLGEEEESQEAPKTEKAIEKKPAKTGVKSKKGTLAKVTKTPKTARPKKTNTNKKLHSKSATKASKTQKQLSKKAIETIYWVQTASLTSRLNAENARKRLTAKHLNAQIFTKQTGTGLTHRVRVGPFKNKTEAEYWLKKVKNMKGFEKSYVSRGKKKN